MSKQSKQLKLVVKNGGDILAIYDDSLVAMFGEAASVEIKRASHVEPHELYGGWYADMRPVDGPVMVGFNTRADALRAEVEYLNEFVVD